MKRVVVIDDQEPICAVVRKLLEPVYETTAFTGSRPALDYLVTGGPCDVVLCDVFLPHMMGPELARLVLAARPELEDAFVFMTGTLETSITVGARTYPVLEKPFGVPQLRRVVEEIAFRPR